MICFLFLFYLLESYFEKDVINDLIYNWKYPKSYMVRKGVTEKLVCQTRYTGSIVMTWKKENVSFYSRENITWLNFSLNLLEPVDTGCYQCFVEFRAKGKLYTNSKETCLTVTNLPSFHEPEIENKVLFYRQQKRKIILSCAATSSTPIVYRWQNENLDKLKLSERSQPQLVIDEPMEGYYICTAHNNVGSSQKAVELVEMKVPDPPRITSAKLNSNGLTIKLAKLPTALNSGKFLYTQVTCYLNESNTLEFKSEVLVYNIYTFIPKVFTCKIYANWENIRSTPVELNFYKEHMSNTTKSQYLSITRKTESNVTVTVTLPTVTKFTKPKQYYLRLYGKEEVFAIDVKKKRSDYTISHLKTGTQYVITLFLKRNGTDKQIESIYTYVYKNDNRQLKKPLIKMASNLTQRSVSITFKTIMPDSKYRVKYCIVGGMCTSKEQPIIKKVEDFRSTVISGLIPANNYDFYITEFIDDKWVDSDEFVVNTPPDVPDKPTNICVEIDKHIYVVFDYAKKYEGILGSFVLVEYSDVTLKYHLDAIRNRINIDKRPGWNLFRIKVYYYNSNGAGKIATKLIGNYRDKDHSKYLYLIIIPMTLLPTLILVTVFYCKDQFKSPFSRKTETYHMLPNTSETVNNEDYYVKNNQFDIPIVSLQSDMHNTEKEIITESPNKLKELLSSLPTFSFYIVNIHSKLKDLFADKEKVLASEMSFIRKVRECKSTRHPLKEPENRQSVLFYEDAQTSFHYYLLKAPRSGDAFDFWSAVLDKCPTVIIMLNCYKDKETNNEFFYLPNERSRAYGNIEVSVTQTNIYRSYVVRELKVRNTSSPGTSWNVKHIIYHKWRQDMREPFSYGCLVEINKLITFKEIGECVFIHCEDGISKAGLFMLTNIILSDGVESLSANVVDTVLKVEDTLGVDILQFQDQLKVIYMCLFEFFSYEVYQISYSSYNKQISESEFELTTEYVTHDDEYDHFNSSTKSSYQQELSDEKYKLPKAARLHRKTVSFIEDFNGQSEYVIASSPDKNALSEFWTDIWNLNIKIILNLHNFYSLTQDECYAYPKKTEFMELDHFTIRYLHPKPVLSSSCSYISVDNVVMVHKETKDVRTIKVLTISKDAEPNPRDLCSICEKIVIAQEILKNSPIMVHCNDGCTFSGVFVAICQCIKSIELEGSTNVTLTVRNLIRQCKYSIWNKNQFELVYKTVQEKFRRDVKNHQISLV